MWTRALLKANAKTVLRRSYWNVFLMCLIASILTGSVDLNINFGGNSGGSSSGAVEQASRLLGGNPITAILSTEIIPSKITASFESVILTGQAVFVEDPAEKRTVMENFVTQKHPGYEELGFRMIEKQLDKTAVIRIDPISMTGKAYLG